MIHQQKSLLWQMLVQIDNPWESWMHYLEFKYTGIIYSSQNFQYLLPHLNDSWINVCLCGSFVIVTIRKRPQWYCVKRIFRPSCMRWMCLSRAYPESDQWCIAIRNVLFLCLVTWNLVILQTASNELCPIYSQHLLVKITRGLLIIYFRRVMLYLSLSRCPSWFLWC